MSTSTGFGNSLADYHDLRAKCLALGANPRDLPSEDKGIAAVRYLHDIYRELSGPKTRMPTPADRAFNDLNALQNEVALKVAQLEQMGLIQPGCFSFEVPEGTTRAAHLQGMQFKCQQIMDEHTLSPEGKVKRLQQRVEALEARLSAIEQELSHT